MADHVQEILNDYTNDNAGTKTSGKLAGTGKLVILPVDQGLNRGPRKLRAQSSRHTIRCTISNWLSTPDAMPTLPRWAAFFPAPENGGREILADDHGHLRRRHP